MEGSIIFYTYGSTLELNGQQFEAGRLTKDLLNLSPDDYHPLHERMVRIRTLMDIYEYVRKSELWWKLNDEMEQLCQELRRYWWTHLGNHPNRPFQHFVSHRK